MQQRNKTIRTLLVVLMALLGLVVVRGWWPKNQTETQGFVASWPATEAAKVTSLLIAEGGSEVMVTREGDGWVVGEYRADGNLIEEVLSALLLPKTVELVSENVEKHADLGVASEAAQLTLTFSEASKGLVVGDTAVGGRYVRFEDDNRVYLLAGLTSNMVSTEVKGWVDPILIRAPENDLEKLTLNQASGVIELEHREEEWYEVGSEQTLDRTEFSAMVNTLESFVTQGLLDEEQVADYSTKPEMILVVKLRDKEPVELAFFGGEEDVVVSSSERKGKYVISSSLKNSFAITRADLVVKPTMTPEAEE